MIKLNESESLARFAPLNLDLLMFGRIVVSLLVVVGASPIAIAGAQSTILVTFEGVIIDGSDYFDSLGFGIGEGVLDGRSISGQFRIFPGRAPVDSATEPEFGDFFSEHPDSTTWFETPTVQIDGMNVSVPDFSQINPPDMLDPDYYNDTAFVFLANDLNSTIDEVFYFRDHFATEGDGPLDDLAVYTLSLDLFGSTDLIDSTDLAQSYTVSDFTGLEQESALASTWLVGNFDILAFFDLTLLKVEIPDLPGDIDSDDDVDRSDVAQFVAVLGGGDAIGAGEGDFTDDGIAGLADLAIVQSYFGQNYAASPLANPLGVPEPATLIQMLLAVLILAICRRSRNPRGDRL